MNTRSVRLPASLLLLLLQGVSGRSGRSMTTRTSHRESAPFTARQRGDTVRVVYGMPCEVVIPEWREALGRSFRTPVLTSPEDAWLVAQSWRSDTAATAVGLQEAWCATSEPGTAWRCGSYRCVREELPPVGHPHAAAGTARARPLLLELAAAGLKHLAGGQAAEVLHVGDREGADERVEVVVRLASDFVSHAHLPRPRPLAAVDVPCSAVIWSRYAWLLLCRWSVPGPSPGFFSRPVSFSLKKLLLVAAGRAREWAVRPVPRPQPDERGVR